MKPPYITTHSLDNLLVPTPYEPLKPTDLEIVWFSQSFPSLPLGSELFSQVVSAQEHQLQALLKLAGITRVTTRSLLEEDLISYSPGAFGRAVAHPPFIFENDTGDRFALLVSKGVGETLNPSGSALRLGYDLPYVERINPSFSLRAELGVQSLVTGLFRLEPALNEVAITEALRGRGFKTAAPVMIIKRNDKYANQAVNYDYTFDESPQNLPVILVRAFKSLFRLDDIELVLRNPRTLHPSAKEILNFEVTLHNFINSSKLSHTQFLEQATTTFIFDLVQLLKNRLLYVNLNTFNVCANGEIVDLDSVYYCGNADTDPQMAQLLKPLPYHQEKQEWDILSRKSTTILAKYLDIAEALDHNLYPFVLNSLNCIPQSSIDMETYVVSEIIKYLTRWQPGQ